MYECIPLSYNLHTKPLKLNQNLNTECHICTVIILLEYNTVPTGLTQTPLDLTQGILPCSCSLLKPLLSYNGPQPHGYFNQWTAVSVWLWGGGGGGGGGSGFHGNAALFMPGVRHWDLITLSCRLQLSCHLTLNADKHLSERITEPSTAKWHYEDRT